MPYTSRVEGGTARSWLAPGQHRDSSGSLPRRRRWLLAAIGLSLGLASPVLSQPAERGVREVTGYVLDAVTGEPLAGAEVRAEAQVTTADDAGRFSLALAPGPWLLETKAEGYASRNFEIRVAAAGSAELEIALVPRGRFREHLEVTARAGAAEEAPATIPVRPQQVVAVAGGAENVFRVLHTLPGVAGADEFGSRFSVRGGGPDQNLTIVDGVEVHNPYRLFGLVSAFNPETVDSFELTAGAFSARYGDRLSSLLLVANRLGSREKALTGTAALSLTDANVILEGKLPKSSGSWLLTGRRTYYDLIGEWFTDSDLPSFNDIQAKAVWDFGEGRSLELFALRSREGTDASFSFEEEGAEGAVFTSSSNDVLAASFQTPLGKRVMSRTILSRYLSADSFEFGGDFRNEGRRSNAPDDTGFATSRVELTWDGTVRDWSLRQELVLQAADRHILETGFELHSLHTQLGFTIPGERNPSEANASSLAGGASLPDELDTTRADSRFGAWLQDRFHVSDRLVVEPGLRLDHSGINGATSLGPRLAATLVLVPSLRLRLGLGLHTQSPGYEKLVQSDYFIDLGESDVLPVASERSRHVLLSLEHDLAPGTLARVEAYYKDFDRLIAGRLETPEERRARVAQYDFPPELADSVPREPWITTFPTNDSRGQAYGFDLYVARRATSPRTRLTGWASYTLGVAKRTAYGRTYPFDYDRRHAFSLVGSLRLGASLTLSATARVASGFPRTPVLGLRVSAVPDSDDIDGDGNTSSLIPERDAEGLLVYTSDLGGVSNLNSARLPVFARLDARLTYVPGWGRGRVRLYVDVINVLNRHNAGFIEPTLEHDPDSDVPRLVETREGWLPFFPSLGIHISFGGKAKPKPSAP